MRALAVTVTAIVLSGCVMGGGSTGPTKLPADAYAAIWTSKPTKEVAACLNGAGLSSTYQARAIRSRDSAFTTIVAITTSDERSRVDPRAYACILK